MYDNNCTVSDVGAKSAVIWGFSRQFEDRPGMIGGTKTRLKVQQYLATSLLWSILMP